MPVSQLSGMTFGRWTVLNRVFREGTRNTYWLCRCACGVEREVLAFRLKDGRSKSCGCLSSEVKKSRAVHGHASIDGRKSPEYRAWAHMLERCNNTNCKAYKNYGGRGISVCERWVKFTNFLADMGTRPSDEHSLDRIDCNGNYSPDNCRWADCRTQQRNRRNNRIITIGGESKCVADWADALEIEGKKLRKALERGKWPKSEEVA